VVCCYFSGDVHLIKGGGLKHRWGEDAYLHKCFAGTGTEVLKDLDSPISNPSPQKLRGLVVNRIAEGGLDGHIRNGLQLQSAASLNHN